ncbi:MAG: type I secretion system permease/ATPase [Salaquimonas sp.]
MTNSERQPEKSSGQSGSKHEDKKILERQCFAALSKICELHKLPFSAKQAVHGVPLDNGTLTLQKIGRAAENLNLKSEFRKENPANISGLLFPLILFFKNGDLGVAVSNDKVNRVLEIWKCARDGREEFEKISLEEVQKNCHDTVILTAPLHSDLDNSTDHGLTNIDETGWFWPIVRRFWPNWTYVVIATFFINFLGLALPLFVMNVYDKVIPNESIPTLWALVGGVGIALLFDFLMRLLRANMIDNSGERVDLAVSANLFERAMDVRMADRQLNAGQISNQVRDFDSVRDFFSSTAITSLIDVVFIFIFLTLLWFIVGPLAIIPMIAVPVVISVMLLIQFPLKRSVEKNQAAGTNRHSVLVDAMVGIETVKAISAESVLQKRWEKAVANSASSGVALRMWSSMAVYFTMLAQQFVSVIVITWGVFLVIDGAITVGALIASNILVGRILAPLGSTATTLVRMQQSFSAFKNIGGLMRLDRDNRQNTRIFAKINSGALEMRDVSFSYRGQTTKALQNLNFKVTPGEKVGIIGRVGSGKSTIGKLLCGLYTQDSGEILLDGTDTRKFPVAELRGAIGYVSQETELFSGSLRENILLAHPERAEQLETAIKVSGVVSFAGAHPLGLELNVGERGRSLSGGQRQAVGLARMIVADPKVFYLDEPTSQMDTKTEMQLIKSLQDWLSPDRTVLLATHRNSLLSLVDRLIVVEAGNIIADGPKDQVLKQLGQVISTKRLKVRSNPNAKK